MSVEKLMTISVKKNFYEKLRQVAEQNQVSISAFVRTAILEKMNQVEIKQATKETNNEQ